MRFFIALVAIFGFSAPALAGYVDALEAYNAGDLRRARTEFESMARLGHVTSQHNLAIMLLRGEGGPPVPVDAFAWFTLASEAGYEPAQKIHAQMAPLATPDDLARAEALRSQFGIEASVKRLSSAIDGFRPLTVKLARAAGIEYPIAAQNRGRQGWVLVEVETNATGDIKDARVIGGVNARDFADSATAGILFSRRAVPSDDLGTTRFGAVPVTYRLTGSGDYGLGAGKVVEGFPGYGVDTALLDELCEKGNKGDPKSQVMCGFMHLFDRSTAEADMEGGREAVVRAALAGQPEAAMLVGSALAASASPADFEEGVVWWGIAAQNGSQAARARVLDAELYARPIDDARIVRAKEWMSAILEGDDDWAIKHVVALFATHPDDRIRDPSRALELSRRLQARSLMDPQIDEIRAAAHAGLGQFRQARWAQEKAIIAAARRDWDTQSMRRRLERYAAGETWHGDLIRDVEAVWAVDRD